MIRGEIYKLKKEFRENYSVKSYNHPFVFWMDEGEGINGIMITCSNKSNYSNKEFDKSHFELGYKLGFGKSKKFSKSYFAPMYLLKKIKFEHLELVGKLTKEGIEHLEKCKYNLEYTDWETHMSKI